MYYYMLITMVDICISVLFLFSAIDGPGRHVKL